MEQQYPYPVFAYRNLHTNTWSLKAAAGPDRGRVIARPARALLKDCTFKVSESGRQRCLREKRKNVHAGVQGIWMGDEPAIHCHRPARYNPYACGSFMVGLPPEPITTAPYVKLDEDGKARVA